jgi:CubicO group peptidase (beta-lactamase class C family)
MKMHRSFSGGVTGASDLSFRPSGAALGVVAVLLAAAFSACGPAAPGADARLQQVDEIFRAWDTTETPGCVAAASRDGAILFERAWGMANLELSVPLSPESVFYAGSVSKQFTDAAIALLALRGQLDLEDDIRTWFPELQFDQRISVSDLIYHTSGIRDYFELAELAGWPDRAYINNAVSLELLTHQTDLNFAPGSMHLYSNSGYMLLAELVERASGQTLREFAAAEIFEPLGMEHSQFEDDYRTIVPNRAGSYGQRPDGSWFRFLKAFDGVGSGGMLTTAHDLLIWNENFTHARVGGPAFNELMLTRGVLTSSEELSYAFGLDHGEYRGAATVSHGGSLKGFRTALTRFPGQHFSVAVLCNFAAANPGDYANRIADVFLADELEAIAEEAAAEGESPEEEVLIVDSETLERYTGLYDLDGDVVTIDLPGSHLRISATGGRLSPLAALSETRFRVMATGDIAEFSIDDAGEATALTLEMGGRRVIAPRLPEYEPSARELAPYEGEYFSEELQVVYRISLVDGRLTLRVRAEDKGALDPLKPDVMLSELGTLRFQRNRGAITGFRLDAGRVRDVAFSKQ